MTPQLFTPAELLTLILVVASATLEAFFLGLWVYLGHSLKDLIWALPAIVFFVVLGSLVLNKYVKEGKKDE